MDSNFPGVAAAPELHISHPPDLLCPHRLSLIVFCLSYRVVPQQEKGSLREALSNNDQPGDLRTVTLSFHTQRKAVIMGGEKQRPRGGALQAGQGMPSIKIDLHYSEFSTNSLKEQGIISFWWLARIVLGGAVEKSCLWRRVVRNDLPLFATEHYGGHILANFKWSIFKRMVLLFMCECLRLPLQHIDLKRNTWSKCKFSFLCEVLLSLSLGIWCVYCTHYLTVSVELLKSGSIETVVGTWSTCPLNVWGSRTVVVWNLQHWDSSHCFVVCDTVCQKANLLIKNYFYI